MISSTDIVAVLTYNGVFVLGTMLSWFLKVALWEKAFISTSMTYTIVYTSDCKGCCSLSLWDSTETLKLIDLHCLLIYFVFIISDEKKMLKKPDG